MYLKKKKKFLNKKKIILYILLRDFKKYNLIIIKSIN